MARRVAQVSILAAQRGAMVQLLRAARSHVDAIKLATLRALVSLQTTAVFYRWDSTSTTETRDRM